MMRKCDLCEKPAVIKYKALWQCREHYAERKAMFDRFYATCQTPGKCARNMLPSACMRCGWTI